MICTKYTHLNQYNSFCLSKVSLFKLSPVILKDWEKLFAEINIFVSCY